MDAIGKASHDGFGAIVINPAASANIINNHIPLDPALLGAIAMSKTTPMTTVSKSGLVQVMDFGLAKRVHTEGTMTATGAPTRWTPACRKLWPRVASRC